jgi:IS30 family transposase
MADEKATKHKHLTDEDRQKIQDCLQHGMTFKAIAKRVGKDQTTISKEVKKHIVIRPSGGRRCKEDGSPIPNELCPHLLKAPFVCNPCRKFHGSCGYDRQVYVAGKAQAAYKALLSEARTGIPLNKETFYRADGIITEGVKRGQHLYHILHTHNLCMSKSTVYRHLKNGYLSIAPLDMPRMVKFKPRVSRKELSVPKALKIGRTHEDFLFYVKHNDIEHWVEMDTVIGRAGGKTIMTMLFTSCNFMFGFLLDDKSCAEVTRVIKSLKTYLAENSSSFGEVFPIILTDNGGEFANVFAIENDEVGQQESHLFFCDPYQSSQKPHVEKNHTMFRDIVPSGSSFDNFSQDTVNTIFSHVNSVKRHGMTGRTAYEMFTFLYGDKLPYLLGIVPIRAEAVRQSPALLKI